MPAILISKRRVKQNHKASFLEEGETLTKRTKHSFVKYQKELNRKKKAEEKLAKRQGKRDKSMDDDKP